MHISKRVALSLAAAGALLVTNAPASANHEDRDLCAGVVESNGCWYCAGTQNPVAPPTSCHDRVPGHSWEQCELWVTATCVLGSVGPA